MTFVSEILSLSFLLVTLTALSSGGPVRPPESRPRRHKPVRDARDIALLDPQDFLSHFLSTLNLTGQRKLAPGPRASPEEPPEFMLELFERFANDRAAVPSANIVRSFKNEDSSPSGVTAGGARRHPLLFNISLPRHEHVATAELRLFTLVQRAQRPSAGLECKVTVYKVHDGVVWTREVGKEVRRRDQEEESKDPEELVTKYIHAKDSSWVSLDMTHAVALWRKYGHAMHKLEVRVAILGPEEAVTWDQGEVSVDIGRSVEGKHNAMMIVYSDNANATDNAHGGDRPEDGEPRPLRPFADRDRDGPEPVREAPARTRRGVKGESCKRTPLFVDFKDIGWDTWIIQPLGYEAYMCNGVCGPPMTSEVSPTKHAIVQTLLSVKSPKRASRACCVPTKLEPISVLYHDNGVITFNPSYEGMVVSECGCR
ncbi:bone morphogenetic protein 10-like [Syngnathoides biaculeatus]|uniref:bone morphogenetic protein 10-like n=1 Tax=Syngnathoides biaculeatus TaxID=300417 RepID=UPI002ADDFF35|nr:bone morphogenetic protein 10-like [Syngnathoides biaculeatus]